MEVLKIASQPQQVEAARLARARGRPQPETAPQTDSQDQAAPAAEPEVDVEQVARDLAVRTNLKVEVVTEEDSGRRILRVMTPDGERLLRQFPPEAVLKLAERLRSGSAEGLLASLV